MSEVQSSTTNPAVLLFGVCEEYEGTPISERALPQKWRENYVTALKYVRAIYPCTPDIFLTGSIEDDGLEGSCFAFTRQLDELEYWIARVDPETDTVSTYKLW